MVCGKRIQCKTKSLDEELSIYGLVRKRERERERNENWMDSGRKRKEMKKEGETEMIEEGKEGE